MLREGIGERAIWFCICTIEQNRNLKTRPKLLQQIHSNVDVGSTPSLAGALRFWRDLVYGPSGSTFSFSPSSPTTHSTPSSSSLPPSYLPVNISSSSSAYISISSSFSSSSSSTTLFLPPPSLFCGPSGSTFSIPPLHHFPTKSSRCKPIDCEYRRLARGQTRGEWTLFLSYP